MYWASSLVSVQNGNDGVHHCFKTKMDKIPTTEDLLSSVGTTGKSRFNRFSGNLQPDQMEVMDE